MDADLLARSVSLRHELHSHPERSGHEAWTKARLMEFLRVNTSLELYDRGQWFYAVSPGSDRRPAVAFRAEFDALPISDESGTAYHSQFSGLGHQCGHDGHSAALAAFALMVDRVKPARQVCFLFQHAEETGEGAQVCCSFLEERCVEAIYAFHNMPGFPLGAVCIRDGTIHCASRGMMIRLTGVPAHASTPELGKNPALAVARLVEALPGLTNPAAHKGLTLCTVIQIDVGEPAFGVSAHRGSLLLTLRAQYEEELDALQSALESLALSQAEAQGLSCAFSLCDVFPETVNHAPCAEAIRAAARALDRPVVELTQPMRCSEDFGHYLQKAPGALFFLGSGENSPPLHSEGFDFPDALISTACELFFALL